MIQEVIQEEVKVAEPDSPQSEDEKEEFVAEASPEPKRSRGKIIKLLKECHDSVAELNKKVD